VFRRKHKALDAARGGLASLADAWHKVCSAVALVAADFHAISPNGEG